MIQLDNTKTHSDMQASHQNKSKNGGRKPQQVGWELQLKILFLPSLEVIQATIT